MQSGAIIIYTEIIRQTKIHPQTDAPAGALISSIKDLLKFAQLHMDGTKPYLAICRERHADGEKTFKSGLARRLEKGAHISWHDGAAGAYSAFVGLDLKKNTVAALAMNCAMVNNKAPALAILNDPETAGPKFNTKTNRKGVDRYVNTAQRRKQGGFRQNRADAG